MYKIIGADQKEYGPVTSDQIRHWISESRVNAQTRARAEGEAEWRPLSEFPEFADLLGPASAPPVPAAAGVFQPDPMREAALRAVKGPAVALMITSILNVIFGLIQLLRFTIWHSGHDLSSDMPQLNDPQVEKILQLAYGPIGIASILLSILVTVLVLVGALRMKALRNYALAVTASILALLPCATPCCFIGLPFAIWALVVLNRAEVKSQFS